MNLDLFKTFIDLVNPENAKNLKNVATNVISKKEIIPGLDLSFIQQLIDNLTGKNNDNKNKKNKDKENEMPIPTFVKDILNVVVPAILFFVLSPGNVLTIPPNKLKSLLFSGMTSRTAIIVHTVVFSIVYTFLRIKYAKYY